MKIINKKRLNIFLERTILSNMEGQKSNFINRNNIYSPEAIPSGLNFNAQAKTDLYKYSDENFQNLFILPTN